MSQVGHQRRAAPSRLRPSGVIGDPWPPQTVTDFIREMRDQRVQGDGVDLWCIEWHPFRSDGSRPVLLLHGMSSNALFWGRVAAELSHRRVLALDLRGHGRSDRPGSGYTVEAMAADVAHALRGLALDGVMVGHSWGVPVALRLAAVEPTLVSRLVLVDGPIASLAGRMSLEEADREMRPPARCYRSPEEIEVDIRRFLREAWGDDLREFARASFTWTPQGWCPVLPEAGRMEMVRSLHAFQPEPLLEGLAMPTLILMASDASDGVAPGVLGWWRSQAEMAAARCRWGEARRHDSGHDIPLIRPAQLAADIDRTGVA